MVNRREPPVAGSLDQEEQPDFEALILISSAAAIDPRPVL